MVCRATLQIRSACLLQVSVGANGDTGEKAVTWWDASQGVARLEGDKILSCEKESQKDRTPDQ